jgi:hypothetical protein
MTSLHPEGRQFHKQPFPTSVRTGTGEAVWNGMMMRHDDEEARRVRRAKRDMLTCGLGCVVSGIDIGIWLAHA